MSLEELVARGDPDRFAVVRAVPALSPLLPLFALNIEVARAPWVSAQPMINEMRLQWWRDVITEPTPRAHEVAAPLHALIQRYQLPIEVIDQMIAARIWDVYAEPFDDAAAFWRYLDDTSGGLYALSAWILGGDPVQARAIGVAAGLASYLRAVPELEKRGRRPLVDGRPQAVRDLAQQGLAMIGGRGLALLPAYQTGALLRQVIRDPMIVARGQMGLSEFSRRSRLLWAALRA